MDKETIDRIIEEHRTQPHMRLLQKTLAKDITIRVHSEADYENAIAASEILFGKSTAADLRNLSNETLLDVFEGVPQYHIPAADFEQGIAIADLLTEKSQVLASKGEFKRAMQENSLSMNKEKLTHAEQVVTTQDLINQTYLLIQRGKKNYYLLIAQ